MENKKFCDRGRPSCPGETLVLEEGRGLESGEGVLKAVRWFCIGEQACERVML